MSSPPRVTTEWYGDRVDAEIVAAMQRALRTVGGRIIRKAVPRAPIEFGHLRRSLRFNPPERDSRGVTMLLGSFSIEYAIYQERGTARITGKFYLQSSIDEEVPRLDEVLAQELKK